MEFVFPGVIGIVFPMHSSPERDFPSAQAQSHHSWRVAQFFRTIYRHFARKSFIYDDLQVNRQSHELIFEKILEFSIKLHEINVRVSVS
jgi:hypothetical protein